MKIQNVELQYYIDYLNKRIHLLDIGESNSSLINAICPQFQKDFIAEENLLLDVIDFEWLCYSFKAPIITFKDYSIHLIGNSEKRLYEPYKRLIEEAKR